MKTSTETAPTVTFTLVGRDRSGGYVRLLDGTTIKQGERGSHTTPYATIRRWASNAAAQGVTNIRLELRRHTRDLGWYNGLSFGGGYELAPRGRRFSIGIEVA